MNIELEFNNEFKKVSRICEDAYYDPNSDKHGVSAYLQEMERNSATGKPLVQDWEFSYEELRRLRGLRNAFAHDTGYVEITQKDLDNLRAFHDMLISGDDPLAILQKKLREKKNHSKVVKTVSEVPNSQSHETGGNSPGCLFACIFDVVVITLLLMLLIR